MIAGFRWAETEKIWKRERGRKFSHKLAPVHPGEILLEEFMKPLELSANRLAIELRVPANRILAIIDGSRAVSADTALRLARYFGTTPEFWINLQAHYDLEIAKDELAATIDRDVRPRAA